MSLKITSTTSESINSQDIQNVYMKFYTFWPPVFIRPTGQTEPTTFLTGSAILTQMPQI